MNGRSAPFRQFVLKVARRCDLSCDHCYVYEHADLGWRRQPMVMSYTTTAGVAERIAQHAQKHGLGSVHVVLHVGVLPLAGPAGLDRFSRSPDRAHTG